MGVVACLGVYSFSLDLVGVSRSSRDDPGDYEPTSWSQVCSLLILFDGCSLSVWVA